MNDKRKEICKIGKLLYEKGFAPGYSGNISVKNNDKILITPSGVCLGELAEEDIIVLDLNGNILQTETAKSLKPSSETPMHVEIYKIRSDIISIVHAHPPKSTSLSVMGVEIKEPLVAEAVVITGEVPLVEYETPSTPELARLTANSFIIHNAVFMANHGATVCGKSAKDAFHRMETLEFLSEVYLNVLFTGKKRLIPKEKIQALLQLKK